MSLRIHTFLHFLSGRPLAEHLRKLPLKRWRRRGQSRRRHGILRFLPVHPPAMDRRQSNSASTIPYLDLSEINSEHNQNDSKPVCHGLRHQRTRVWWQSIGEIEEKMLPFSISATALASESERRGGMSLCLHSGLLFWVYI